VWLRLLGTRLTSRFEDDLVALFRDRLHELERPRTGGAWLLARAVVDALRHGGADRGQRSSRPGPAAPRSASLLDAARRDVRFALRSLARRPVFAAIAVITLGLGIGGTTTIFTVVDAVLIRDLPYEDPSRVVSVWKAWPAWRSQDGLDYVWDHIQLPWEEYLAIRDGVPSLADVAAYQNDANVLFGRGEPLRVSTGLASANLFSLLGVRLALGRAFRPEEVPPEGDAARVVVLSHELWQRRFGADQDVVGTTVRLDAESYEVVGVLPAGFRMTSDLITTHQNGGTIDAGLRDVWLPLGSDGVDCGNCFELLGRLAPGRTAEQARQEIQPLLTAQTPDPNQVARVVGRKEVVTRGFGTPILMLLGAAAVLLLIACTNVAALMLGEAPGRSREVAVRFALGAGRARILRQLLTEAVLIGVLGAAAGVALAMASTGALLSVAPPMPRLEEVRLSGRVLAFASGVGVLTGVLFGIAPAGLLATPRGSVALRGRTPAPASRPLLMGVVSAQVGLTVVLLVAGALFGRSLVAVMAVDPGFEADGLATFGVEVPPGDPAEPEDLERFYREVLVRLEAVPGVLAVSATSTLPFPGGTNAHSFGYVRGGEEVVTTQWARWVHSDYLEVLGVPLLTGRTLGTADDAGAARVMLVSASLAERNWPGESPLGAQIRYFGGDPWTVVGVVGDVRQRSLGAEPEATFYVSSAQLPRRSMDVVVRTASDPAAALPALRDAVWAVDPDIPIARAAPMTDLVRESEADDRFRALLMWVFAALAVLLAAVGIFGVTARTVAARSREIGIRTALGARSGSLVALVVREGLSSALLGTAVGLIGALLGSRLVGHLLYEVDAHDPLSFFGAAAVAVAVCGLSAYVPARRVTSVAPLRAIVDE
jgi:predicted permease